MTTQFNWLQYLEVAEDLARQPGEAYSRSAVSRAYYGVLCHIRDRLQERGHSFSRGRDIHGQVIDLLRNDSRRAVARLGYHLSQLRRQRNRADYQTNDRFDASRTGNALLSAKRIANSLGALFT